MSETPSPGTEPEAVQTALPGDHPITVAWAAYTASPEYANSLQWAAREEHRQGSMWAAFLHGWRRAERRKADAAAQDDDSFVAQLPTAMQAGAKAGFDAAVALSTASDARGLEEFEADCVASISGRAQTADVMQARCDVLTLLAIIDRLTAAPAERPERGVFPEIERLRSERPCPECGRGMTVTALAEIAGFRDRLARQGAATSAAGLSLMQRVREFVEAHSLHGSRTGRPLMRMDEIERLRTALAEYDRVRATSAEGAERGGKDD
jgi:hypothetical protein